jgi:hypothetical protein
MLPSRFLQEIPRELTSGVSRSSTEFERARIYEGTSRDFAPQPVSSSQLSTATLGSAGFETHDSVEAVKGFFKRRDLAGDVGAGPDRAAPASAMQAVPIPSDSSSPRPEQRANPPDGAGPFSRGAKVRHKRFGVGVVQQCQGQGERAKLRVYFRQHGIKTLIAGPAKLQAL